MCGWEHSLPCFFPPDADSVLSRYGASIAMQDMVGLSEEYSSGFAVIDLEARLEARGCWVLVLQAERPLCYCWYRWFPLQTASAILSCFAVIHHSWRNSSALCCSLLCCMLPEYMYVYLKEWMESVVFLRPVLQSLHFETPRCHQACKQTCANTCNKNRLFLSILSLKCCCKNLMSEGVGIESNFPNS